ncbi:hypothetical protein [Rhizobium sp. 21-4511-3d]
MSEHTIEIEKVPGFVLRDAWIDGLISTEQYSEEVRRRQEVRQAEVYELQRTREALEGLLVQALQSNVNSAANAWGLEAITKARAVLGGRWALQSAVLS